MTVIVATYTTISSCPRTSIHIVVSARATPLARHAKPPTPVPPSPPPRVLYYRWGEPNPEEDGEVLRISTEKPLGDTENEAGQSRDDRVERRQIPGSYRVDPPDEFQFPPKRVPEPGDQTSRTDPVVPVPDPEMEDLSDTHYTRKIFLTHQRTLSQQKLTQKMGMNYQTRSDFPQTQRVTSGQTGTSIPFKVDHLGTNNRRKPASCSRRNAR